MTERTELLKLDTLRFHGVNNEPSSHTGRRLGPRPVWANALVYGTMSGCLRWVAQPITSDVVSDVKAVDATTGEPKSVGYASGAGWRNVWILPEPPAVAPKFYACVVEDVDIPYATLELAQASAERHAQANPGTRVTVMQEHGAVVATTKLDWS